MPPEPEFEAEDLVRLRHMVEAAEDALAFIRGRDRRDLDQGRMLALALARAVEIVGEAASHVSTRARGAVPGIPWNAIVGMRNRLVHAYLDVDHDILWTTVTERLPELIRHLLPVVDTNRG